MNRIALALLAGAMSLSPELALADEGDHSLEEIVVEMAHTKGEHAALARHYRAKAEDPIGACAALSLCHPLPSLCRCLGERARESARRNASGGAQHRATARRVAC